MPIYEYRCRECRREMSFIVLSAESAQQLCCKYCGSQELSQLISRFSTPLSEDARMERLADPSRLGDIDENDPASMARWMKRMGKEMGEDMGEDFDQAIEEAMAEEQEGKEPGEAGESSPAGGGMTGGGLGSAGEW